MVTRHRRVRRGKRSGSRWDKLQAGDKCRDVVFRASEGAKAQQGVRGTGLHDPFPVASFDEGSRAEGKRGHEEAGEGGPKTSEWAWKMEGQVVGSFGNSMME
jgi:hypothetical protein